MPGLGSIERLVLFGVILMLVGFIVLYHRYLDGSRRSTREAPGTPVVPAPEAGAPGVNGARATVSPPRTPGSAPPVSPPTAR